MTIIHRLAGIGLALTAAAGTTGCQPDPTPGTVTVLGDSLTIQSATMADGLHDTDGTLDVYAGLGWRIDKARDHTGYITPPMDYLAAQASDIENPRPEVAVIALGTNDTVDGWDLGDWARFHWTATEAVGPATCVVAVTPGHGPEVTGWRAEAMQQAAADIAGIADGRPGPAVVVDWQAIVNADLTLLDTDGIHLADTRAAQVRNDAIWGAVEDCQGML